MRVLQVAPGGQHHGVVRHADTLARLLTASGNPSLRGDDASAVDVVHAHFTDALWGPDVATAAAAFRRWRSSVDAPVVVTLHDVPGRDVDPPRDARRTPAYAAVAQACDGVVVSAAREALPGLGAVVVPLPVVPLEGPGQVPAWADRLTVGVLGFVYPGKGHEQVLRAVPPGQRVVAAGAPSPGHGGLVDDLRALADDRGVDLVVTGPLDEPDLHAAVLAVTVPVAAYRTLGSSASVATWAACGRRPLAPAWSSADDGVLVVPDLAEGIAAALAEPSPTWTGTREVRDTVAEHLQVYRSCA